MDDLTFPAPYQHTSGLVVMFSRHDAGVVIARCTRLRYVGEYREDWVSCTGIAWRKLSTEELVNIIEKENNHGS